MKKDIQKDDIKKKRLPFKNPKFEVALKKIAIICCTVAITLLIVGMILIYSVPDLQFASIAVVDRTFQIAGITLIDTNSVRPENTIIIFVLSLPIIVAFGILLIIDKILYRRKQKPKESKNEWYERKR